MTGAGWAQLSAVALALAAVAPLLGRYLAAVFGPGPAPATASSGPMERLVFRLIGVEPSTSRRWASYALSVVAFVAVSTLGLYGLLRSQGIVVFYPTGAPGVPSALAFDTALSFVTGTNWRAYAGESAMSHLNQRSGLVVAQFTAAVGLAVAVAVVLRATERLTALSALARS